MNIFWHLSKSLILCRHDDGFDARETFSLRKCVDKISRFGQKIYTYCELLFTADDNALYSYLQDNLIIYKVMLSRN